MTSTDPSAEITTIEDAVAVAEEVAGCCVPGKRLDYLLRRARSRGLFCDIELDHAATMVREHDEDEEHPEGYGGHGEEIDGHEVLDVIVRVLEVPACV